MLKNILKTQLKKRGYEIKKINPTINEKGYPIDMYEQEFIRFYEQCKPHTTCTIEPMYALFKAVEYIAKNNIKGDLVECGVFKGGSAMMMALVLKHHHQTHRKIYLYDTFEGMSAPTDNDKDFSGNTANLLLKSTDKETGNVWCYAPLELVKNNMELTTYPTENIIYVKGKVEDTIPNTIPQHIALLRLDTDWYESTKHELIHLYPLLLKNGVLIIDDYGHWQGARKAVDEYFEHNKSNILLNRVDYTVRIATKS